MYKTLYDWNNSQFLGFDKFLKHIYEESILFAKTQKDSKGSKQKITEFVQNLEIYMYSLIKMGYVNKSNLENVLSKLLNIKLIKTLDSKNKNLAGFTYNNIISLNPCMVKSANLSSKSRTFLYSSHEYTHMINNAWKIKISPITNEIWKNKWFRKESYKYNYNSEKYFSYGLQFLDEVIAQDTAENITYNVFSQKRPDIHYEQNPQMFSQEPYLTNFDFYGDFQEIAVKFCHLLDFLNVNNSMSFNQVLEKLSKASMDKNFLNNVLSFLNDDKEVFAFYIMICSMGLIKDAHYKIANLNYFKDSQERSLEALQLFNDLYNHETQQKSKIYNKVV